LEHVSSSNVQTTNSTYKITEVVLYKILKRNRNQDGVTPVDGVTPQDGKNPEKIGQNNSERIHSESIGVTPKAKSHYSFATVPVPVILISLKT